MRALAACRQRPAGTGCRRRRRKRSRLVAPSTSVTAGAARTIGVLRAGERRSSRSALTAYCCST